MDQKNIDKLINKALAIEQEEAYQAGAIGYMARVLIQATMPHSKIDSHEFKRQNGAFRLTMLADSEIGLPYGSMPRLLMAWITTEAVRTKQRELILGKSLAEFMRELGLIASGGRWGTISRLKDQMKRLFSASISCVYEDGEKWMMRNAMPVEMADIWWNPKNPHQATIWDSKLLLGEIFFNEIIQSPIPIDMRALKALKQSPMAIDIYCWLTYRMHYLRNITSIPWNSLEIQFGANYKDLRQFKRRFIDQLKKVLVIYASQNIRVEADSLILLPGSPHIKERPKASTQKESKIIEESVKLEIDAEWQKKYLDYQLDAVVEIVENLQSTLEKHFILKSFENHLIRSGLLDIRSEIIQGNHTRRVKEELYRFVNSNWHDIIAPIKSYEEFCKMLS